MAARKFFLIAFLSTALAACSNSGSSPRTTYNQTPASLQNATPAVNSAAVNWTNNANSLLNSSNVNPNNSQATNIMLISSLRESIAEAAQNASTNQLSGIRDYGAPFLYEYVSAYDQVLSGLIYSDGDVEVQEARLLTKLQELDPIYEQSKSPLDKLLEKIQKLYRKTMSSQT